MKTIMTLVLASSQMMGEGFDVLAMVREREARERSVAARAPRQGTPVTRRIYSSESVPELRQAVMRLMACKTGEMKFDGILYVPVVRKDCQQIHE